MCIRDRIDAGLDTGAMLLKAETEIPPDEDAPSLGKRLAAMGADLLLETLEGLAAGAIVPEAQDPALATYAPMLKKEDGRIDWTRAAARIHNQVRGLQPSPGAYTGFRGQTLHVRRSRVVGSDGRPGTVVSVKPLLVACGQGALELIEVQSEGRNRVSARDFANGQRLTENEELGD